MLLRSISLEGNIDPMPSALYNFTADNEDSRVIARNIGSIIKNDLTTSGLYRFINNNAFIETIRNFDNTPHYASWKQINTSILITGQVKSIKPGEVSVDFRLWDIFGGHQLVGKSYATHSDNVRRVAHLISDEIYKKTTGENGYFDTRIVYVAESGPALSKIKRLAIMDSDGANHKFLTSGNSLSLTPRFSPDAQKIMYLSFAKKQPKVYIRDIASGKEKLVGDFPGMSFSPRFSSDGHTALMSVAHNGKTDIYSLDLRTLKQERLTNHPAINVSPSLSTDNKQVVFNSNRAGTPQLYVGSKKNLAQAKRISFGEGIYASPVWSPRGDFIAFIKILRKKFHLGVIRPDGSGERILTSGYLLDSPTWSSNGRVILYTKEFFDQNKQKHSKLYSIDVTGYNEHEIPTPLDASGPSWSSLLE